MSSQSSLQAGIHAFKAGDKVAARAHLMQAVEADETDEQAWLWLAGVMDDPAETRICLDNVLHLNPANERAKQGLAWLQKQHSALFAPAPPAPVIAAAPPVPVVPVVGATLSLADLAASPPDVPAPVPGPTYQVLPADGSATRTDSSQPCPRCGKPTKIAERRCRACGMSLMIKLERTNTIRVPATAAGVLSVIYSAFYVLIALAILILASTNWTTLKKEFVSGVPTDQQTAYLEQYATEIDSVYDSVIQPRITIGVIILLIGVIGVILAVGVVKLRHIPYWLNWGFIGLNWTSAVWIFIQRNAAISDLLAVSSSPRDISILKALRAGAIIPPLLLTIILICMAFAWRLFTRESIRFIAPTLETGDASDYFNRGVNYRKRGMWYQSMVEWQRAVTISPQDATYRHALGLVYDQMKRPIEARHELAEAQRLDPNNMAIMQDAQRLGA